MSWRKNVKDMNLWVWYVVAHEVKYVVGHWVNFKDLFGLGDFGKDGKKSRRKYERKWLGGGFG